MKNSKKLSELLDTEKRRELFNSFTNLTPKEKDAILVTYFSFVREIVDSMGQMSNILKLLSNPLKNEAEIKLKTKEMEAEIENIISLGPKWLNFTRKTKKKKKI